MSAFLKVENKNVIVVWYILKNNKTTKIKKIKKESYWSVNTSNFIKLYT